ncbi:ankyrin repeat and SOCS box protein 2 [Sander lucioperca]|uniref:ankyrin repeat and SOCS box protein 2 n=1 Tax=Sander lucioperca TaxID=283035 RepID=UPI0016536C82|nr:ankyrin repeat and SOCS box protein 2 [Sander lucioperca]
MDMEDLSDYSIYSQLTDEELLQLAVERSLSDHQMISSSSDPPHRPDPPTPPDNPNCDPFNDLYKALRRGEELSPVQAVIMDGDAAALTDLVGRRCSSLMEPNDEGWIALHEAAYYGQLHCVAILIKAYPDSVNSWSLMNQTALLLAAGQGNISCVDFLLRHGADPNIANKDRETPLLTACEKPNEAIVELLLKFGAQVNRCSVQGETCLHVACRHGQLNLCRTLLEAGAELNRKNIYGLQPIFTAAQHGHADIINLLASKGADINGQAPDGASPLFEACKNGHVLAVEALLSLKADANRSMKSGLLPLHAAVQNNHSRIVSLLIPLTSMVRVRRCGISPLHVAAEHNRDDIMALLIQSGFDVNSRLSCDRSAMFEDRRSTALYFSVINGNLDAAEMLLVAGADPDLDVFNPLLIAVRLCWMEMAALLLHYGANANAQIATEPCSFPAAILLRMESLPMLKLLLDHGCDAAPCFDCPYGGKTHPPVTPARRPIEEMRGSRAAPPQRCVQFCEVVSGCRGAGPIISLLLDYVGHVRLCSRLLDVLDSRSDWKPIKLKALPPHPLMQLCRLKIRHQVGVRKLKLLHTLPLPVTLVRFLHYDVHCSLS